jgi:hypothetical protein
MDKMIEQLEHTNTLWTDVVKQMPITTTSLVPLVKNWSGIIEGQIDTYSKEMSMKLKQFKTRPFWLDDITPEEARYIHICIFFYIYMYLYINIRI